MDIKRRIARVVAILAVALGAGHFVQNFGDEKAPPKRQASSELTDKPVKVEQVAAGPEAPKAPALASTSPTPALPEAPLAQPASPATSEPAAEATVQPAPVTQAATPEPAAQPAVVEAPAPVAPQPAAPVAGQAPSVLAGAAPAAELPAAEVAADAAAVAPACDIILDLSAEPSAMIGVSLLAPCNPGERVVIRHGGLAVTGQTLASGGLFTALPGLETEATVEIAFADGQRQSATITLPDLAGLRRFGVQYQGDDAFQVHAFEDGADYGQPGHVSAADPHRPMAGQPAVGGFLTLAGDSTVENPLLAEVYTFPADPAVKPDVVVEAAVTDLTCGRELIGETLASFGGSVYVTDLTLAMPDCDAVGDYLVLKNLVPDLNMAAAN